MSKRGSAIWNFLLSNRSTLLLVIAFVFTLLSYIVVPQAEGMAGDVENLEEEIRHRQTILQDYVYQAFEIPVGEWLQFDDFPEDMVLYRYNADTLQSWVNQFPVANDEVDVLTLWHRINHLNSRSLFNAPLAYLTEQEQYVNLGSAWYVVKVYRKEGIKIISDCLLRETLGVTGKFGLGIWNKAGQRLIEFCQENALVIANILFQQHKR